PCPYHRCSSIPAASLISTTFFSLFRLVFSSLLPRAQRSTLFPYTTLFRSETHRLVNPGDQVGLDREFPLLHAHHTIRDSGRIEEDRKSTRLNSSHGSISYAVFCLKK